MPRLMYDSTDPFAIPADAQMVAGYVDGLYAWPYNGWARFASARQVRIAAVSLDLSAHVLDIESGAMSPAQGAEFVRLKRARGEHPSLYFSESRLGEIQAALVAAGLDPYHSYSAWVALWDGRNEQWDGAVAHQFADPLSSGGHWDLSWVADYWEGVDGLPSASPTSGPGVSIENWAGLVLTVEADIPGFGAELGVLASGLKSLG